MPEGNEVKNRYAPTVGVASAGELMGAPDTRVMPPPTPESGFVPKPSTGPRKPLETQSDRSQARTHELQQVNWEALEPTTFYARHGHRLLALLVLLPALPIALLLALPIALINLVIFRNPREILFRQERVGHRGRVFNIFKFRTMTQARGSSFSSWTTGEDTLRVTPFGRLLRNAHLDELPQFLNILLGEMNLIGPRPEMVEIDEWAGQAVPGFHRRLALRPGITGRSQITQGYTGRSADAYAVKLEGDEAYRNQISLVEDLRILGGTVLWVIRGRGWRWFEGVVEEEDGKTSAVS